MPSIAGPIKINSISNGGVFQVGDTLNISPKNNSKTYLGAGGSNTGDFLQTNSVFSLTNTSDPDLVDSNDIANN